MFSIYFLCIFYTFYIFLYIFFFCVVGLHSVPFLCFPLSHFKTHWGPLVKEFVRSYFGLFSCCRRVFTPACTEDSVWIPLRLARVNTFLGKIKGKTHADFHQKGGGGLATMSGICQRYVKFLPANLRHQGSTIYASFNTSSFWQGAVVSCGRDVCLVVLPSHPIMLCNADRDIPTCMFCVHTLWSAVCLCF